MCRHCYSGRCVAYVALLFFFIFSALDELEDDEDFATAGTESRTQGVGDGQGIKAMEVWGPAHGSFVFSFLAYCILRDAQHGSMSSRSGFCILDSRLYVSGLVAKA